MSYRFMRVIVFFDLPVVLAEDRKEYARFRKFLIKDGFLMLQESVYCKLAQNAVAVDSILKRLEQNKPQKGLVQVLCVTEKQYAKMHYLVGEKTSDVLDSDERLVIL